MRRENENKPCSFRTIDKETGKEKTVAPNVACTYNCDKCGFNPAAMRRRFEDGRFRAAKERLSMMSGCMEPLPDGTVRLVFPR